MQQDVSQILVFDRREAPRSVVDILEIEGTVSEVAQIYRRHWRGGQWAGCHAGNFVAIRAGYTIGGRAFFPLGYSPL